MSNKNRSALVACTATLIFAFLSGCGGSGKDDSPVNTPIGGNGGGSGVRSGQFIDGPVGGLEYNADGGATRKLTDNNGRFDYQNGDRVYFFISGIALGSSDGATFVMPGDLHSDAEAAINLSVFLLTLDADRDSRNGIQISQAVRQAAAGESFDASAFAVSESEFDQSGLATFAKQANGDSRSLVSRQFATIELACSKQDIEADGRFDGNCSTWFIADDNSPAAAPNQTQTREQVAALTALFAARAGDTIEFGEGAFEFSTTLVMAHKEGITIKGQGRDRTVLDFATSASPEGISMSHMTGVTIEDLTVIDTPGFSIKVSDSDHVTMRRIRAMWSSGGAQGNIDARGGMDPKQPETLAVSCEHQWPDEFARPANVVPPAGPGSFPDALGYYTDKTGARRNYSVDSSNGGYAIYPVLSNNVLLDDVIALGAADAGIYVGQSNDIIVRNSEALFNVAGYEIENSDRADMYDNVAHCNTAGFLVFDLPGLNQYGEQTRVYDNYAGYNNQSNFARGGVVSAVPQGTGLLQLGYDKVEFFNNVVEFNRTLGFVAASHQLLEGGKERHPDQRMDLFPEGIHIHDNLFRTNGTAPQPPEEGAITCQSGTGGKTGNPCVPTGIDEGHDSLLPALVQIKSAQAKDAYPGQGAHIVWDGYFDDEPYACQDIDGAPVDADGKPDFNGQHQPGCRYNRYKFNAPDNSSAPDRRHPDYWLCFDDSNTFENGRPFMNFDGINAEEPPAVDSAAHDCLARFGRQLAPLPAATVAPYQPGAAGSVPPGAAEIAAICENYTDSGINRAALAYNCDQLSHYNLFTDATDPRSGFNDNGLLFDLVTPLFSDYAVKYRVLFLPPGEAAQWNEGHRSAPNATLDFPVGTVIAKTFAFRDRNAADEDIVETRLLIHRAGKDGDSFWEGMAYIWREDGSDADIALAGASRAASWDYDDTDPEVSATYTGSTASYAVPTPNQCGNCHINDDRQAGDAPIGPKVRNLNRPMDYGNGPVNQLQYWVQTGRLENEPALEVDNKHIARGAQRLARLSVAMDSYSIVTDEPGRVDAMNETDRDIENRIRGWLETNCAHCHNRKGLAQSTGLFFDVFRKVNLNFGICKTPTTAGSSSGGHSYDILPGNASESIASFRLHATDPSIQMPPIARSVSHAEAVTLFDQWVDTVVDGSYESAGCEEQSTPAG